MRERYGGHTFHTLSGNSLRYPIHSIMHQSSNDTEMTLEETFESDIIKGTHENDSQE